MDLLGPIFVLVFTIYDWGGCLRCVKITKGVRIVEASCLELWSAGMEHFIAAFFTISKLFIEEKANSTSVSIAGMVTIVTHGGYLIWSAGMESGFLRYPNSLLRRKHKVPQVCQDSQDSRDSRFLPCAPVSWLPVSSILNQLLLLLGSSWPAQAALNLQKRLF